MASAMSTGVTFLRAEEFSDLRTYDAPDVLRHVMGFGDTPDKALTGPMLKMQDGLFMQAVRCASISSASTPIRGFVPPRRWRLGPRRSVPPSGPIQPGQVAGRKFHWEALVGDDVVVQVTVNWFMGEENLDPPWTFGPAGQRYEMEVKGNPAFTVTFKGFQSEPAR